MSKKLIPLAVCSLSLFSLSLPAARLALAAPTADMTYNVTSTADEVDDDPVNISCHTAPDGPAAGACTLRAAVMQADLLPASYLNVTIHVPAGTYTFSRLASVVDGADNGDLNLTAGSPVISIVGAGAASTTIDAHQLDRVFKVELGRTATISGVTLRGGYLTSAVDDGAGLQNSGTLTLDHSTVSGNQTNAARGGGIFNQGTLTVRQSTIGPNNSAFYGGGLFNGAMLMVVDRSTVYGNSADTGGGLFNFRDQNLIVLNSTFSQNSVVKDGGGIFNDGIANVYNSTIVFNGADSARQDAGSAGGVFSLSTGTFNMRNTLLAGNNVGNTPVYDDCTGTINSYGENLLGEAAPCTIVKQDGNWDVLNSLSLIGPLQDNGGPTMTHGLLAGSNAIDAGDNCTDEFSVQLATDQRGLPRIVNSVCDIGAFEYSPLSFLFLPLTRR